MIKRITCLLGTHIARLAVGSVLAVQAFPSLADPDPGDFYKSAYWLLQQADIARDEGRIDEARESYAAALKIYETILATFPAWEKDLVRFRLSYCQDQSSALASGRAGVGADEPLPEEPAPDLDTMLLDARELSIQNSPVEAAELLATLIRTEPSIRQARELMGIVQLQLGQTEYAAAVLRALSVEQTPSVETLIALAGAECSLGEWTEAHRCLEQALAFEPTTAIIHYNLAQLFLNSSTPDLEAASAAYLKFLSLGGKHDAGLEKRLKR